MDDVFEQARGDGKLIARAATIGFVSQNGSSLRYNRNPRFYETNPIKAADRSRAIIGWVLPIASALAG